MQLLHAAAKLRKKLRPHRGNSPHPENDRLLWTLRGTGQAVYRSCAVQNRINRRVSKETPRGEIVLEFGINPHATAARHADIDYLPGLAGVISRKSRKKENMVVQVPAAFSYIFCFQFLSLLS